MVSINVSYDDVNKNNILLNENNNDKLSNRGSDIESRNVVEVRVFNEREYRSSLSVEGEQWANFYGVKCEAETSQVLMEDKSSSIVFVEDERSSECQISCLCLSGRARWCFNNKVVLPSVWNENVKCCEK